MSPPRRHADLRNPDYRGWRKFLRHSDDWDAERIAEYQLAELRRVVRHACEHAPGYRELFRSAGVGPDDLKAPEDLWRFPFVEKEMIRDQLSDFSVKARGGQYVTTGGSTGIPFGFYRDRVAFARELASKAHQYARVGWREGHRQLVFRGVPLKGRRHIQLFPRFSELRCSSYHMVPGWMEAYRRRALEYRPQWLRCYPSSGHLFARFLKETGRSFPPLRGILCASENLYPFQKELMREVFGARVFSHYGHYEMAVLAGFCERQDTYHVLPQYGYAELLDRSGRPVTAPGAMGEIVATSFLMAITPFIRYRTRDYAVLKHLRGCPACGRPYQVWERIEGRLQEFLVTADGRLISMTAVNMHDGIFDHISQFQFRQHQAGKATFCYVPKASCRGHVAEDMRRRLLRKLGGGLELAMRAVREIPPTVRGKHRFLVQDLRLEVGDA